MPSAHFGEVTRGRRVRGHPRLRAEAEAIRQAIEAVHVEGVTLVVVAVVGLVVYHVGVTVVTVGVRHPSREAARTLALHHQLDAARPSFEALLERRVALPALERSIH